MLTGKYTRRSLDEETSEEEIERIVSDVYGSKVDEVEVNIGSDDLFGDELRQL